MQNPQLSQSDDSFEDLEMGPADTNNGSFVGVASGVIDRFAAVYKSSNVRTEDQDTQPRSDMWSRMPTTVPSSLRSGHSNLPSHAENDYQQKSRRSRAPSDLEQGVPNGRQISSYSSTLNDTSARPSRDFQPSKPPSQYVTPNNSSYAGTRQFSLHPQQAMRPADRPHQSRRSSYMSGSMNGNRQPGSQSSKYIPSNTSNSHGSPSAFHWKINPIESSQQLNPKSSHSSVETRSPVKTDIYNPLVALGNTSRASGVSSRVQRLEAQAVKLDYNAVDNILKDKSGQTAGSDQSAQSDQSSPDHSKEPSRPSGHSGYVVGYVHPYTIPS